MNKRLWFLRASWGTLYSVWIIKTSLALLSIICPNSIQFTKLLELKYNNLLTTATRRGQCFNCSKKDYENMYGIVNWKLKLINSKHWNIQFLQMEEYSSFLCTDMECDLHLELLLTTSQQEESQEPSIVDL